METKTKKSLLALFSGSLSIFYLIRHIRNQSHLLGAFDGLGQVSLMFGAKTGFSSWFDFHGHRQKPAQGASVFPVDFGAAAKITLLFYIFHHPVTKILAIAKLLSR